VSTPTSASDPTLNEEVSAMRKKLALLTFVLAVAAAAGRGTPAAASLTCSGSCPANSHRFCCPTYSFCCPDNAECVCLQ
jgi:hypothetical protein